jgi:chromosome segregation ATPase
MQAPQPLRTAILPSPSSLNFPNAPTLPSISPPSAAGQTSAQSAHLQDLQHQISVKTLAFQTLQREYDSLLQKLERQRAKCATLEKKFEVSDVEINSLTDEKEKLQMQLSTLETQVEEIQQSRDESRRQLVANGAQYMRIMEMANRLQAQGAEDKKKWEAERTELEQRIHTLEEAMVTGTENTPSEAENHSSASPVNSSVTLLHNPAASNTSQLETINVLRAEVGRLRSRTQALETALQTMRRESISIQAAARQLGDSSDMIENVAQGVIGTGG